MAITPGYREGQQRIVSMPVDSSTAAISMYDFVTLGTAGYIQKAAAGDWPCGIALEECAVPSADGDVSILIDTSEMSIYEYPPDTGSVTAALAGTRVDLGGAQSINIDATTDKCFRILRADVINNTVYGHQILAAT